MVSLVISAGNSFTSAGCFEDGEPVCLVKNFPWGFLLLSFKDGFRTVVGEDFSCTDPNMIFDIRRMIGRSYRSLGKEERKQWPFEIERVKEDRSCSC
mmetsp:Transcript_10812/g.13342  ORF Transcript_10812/g.13342 Transcript_10812/m.13342 type:complete len:97 (+) Transcript_10812:1000-1290(+)